MAAVAPILGKWEMYSSENYEEYLKAVGVGALKRKLASGAKPTLIYTESNGKISQKTVTMVKSFDIIFELGVEFEETTADDRKAKAIITIDGNKLTHKQSSGEFEAITIREFSDNEMVTTFKAGSVVAVRKFKKVP